MTKGNESIEGRQVVHGGGNIMMMAMATASPPSHLTHPHFEEEAVAQDDRGSSSSDATKTQIEGGSPFIILSACLKAKEVGYGDEEKRSAPELYRHWRGGRVIVIVVVGAAAVTTHRATKTMAKRGLWWETGDA